MKTLIKFMILCVITLCIFSCSSKIIAPSTSSHFDSSIIKACALSDVQLNKNAIPQEYLPFVAAFSRSVDKRLPQSGLIKNLILEREMSTKGLGSEAYVIHFRVVDFKAFSRIRGKALFRDKEYVEITVEMFVFNVSNVPIEQIKSTDFDVLVNTYKTTDLMPIIKTSYVLTIKSKVLLSAKPEKIIAFSREMADDLAIQLINKSSSDIISALGKKN
jgi:hypothetical protein